MPPVATLDLDHLVSLCSRAGAKILDLYGRAEARSKTDGSPLTEADTAADEVIARGLAEIAPGLPVLSEEAVDSFEPAQAAGRFILVDPLDGTREFLCGNGEFTVNVALIQDGRPRAGVVYSPVRGRAWAGALGRCAETYELLAGQSVDAGTPRRAIHVRQAGGPLTVAVSRSHCDPGTEAYLCGCEVAERIVAGSSLKFCLLAEGLADLYPRFSPTMEWDTAAGQAVLEAAGGVVLAPDGGAFRYGKVDQGFRNGPFVAASAPELIRRGPGYPAG
jgi:3'(2'), 5'-bisphosphate nucleotidase